MPVVSGSKIQDERWGTTAAAVRTTWARAIVRIMSDEVGVAGVIARDGVMDAPVAQDGSARQVAAVARAVSRRIRQRKRLRPILWTVMVVTLLSAWSGHPRPGRSGTGLVLTIALVVYCSAIGVAAIDRWPDPRGRGALLFCVVTGAAGVGLAGSHPSSGMEIPAVAAIMSAFIQLPLVTSVVFGVPLTGALVAVMTWHDRSPLEETFAVVLLAIVMAVTAILVRQAGESQDRTELLLAQLQDAREGEARAAALAERGRIARELHDVLAQTLSALAIQTEGARKLAEREGVSDALLGLVVRSGELTREGLSEARIAVGALGGSAPTVDQLAALVDRSRRDLEISVSLSVAGAARPLAEDVGHALYRGAQEALTNAARYARGGTVSVLLAYEDARVVLTVRDLGGVASPALAGSGGGRGLQGMRDRLERLGGTVRAEAAGDGWLVEMAVPT